MDAPKGQRGYFQSAYRIIVKDPKGKVVWDTRKVKSSISTGISYSGVPLRPTTKYTFTLTVWNQDGKAVSESSWFETGLMDANANLSAWDGATWIGGSDDDLVLYSQYLPVFKVEYTVELDNGSTQASFILGANDERLMDKNKNIYNIQNGKNESYIKFELDISRIDESGSGVAKLNIYRVGYSPSDKADAPFKSIDIPRKLIDEANKYGAHDIHIWSNCGLLTICINGIEKE